ncbi:chemotaxis response regulator protein-glutamate methylesterase [Desulfatiferula olefinivorans]
MDHEKIRVLVIDDSPFVREILTTGLNQDPHIEVVGTASDPYSARDKIVSLDPDVLTLDVSMPRMNGLEFLQKLMPQYPLPTVMVSAFTGKGAAVTLEALEYGAVDFVAKPRSGRESSLADMLVELRTKIKIASTVNVSHWKARKPLLFQAFAPASGVTGSTGTLVALGASTGGTEAIRTILMQLPPTAPGMVIVQHMPEKFTEMFARRLNAQCRMQVSEARSGDVVEPGRVLIAPGNRHMEVYERNGRYEVLLKDGEPVSGHRPSVDILMRSVARCAGPRALGVLLTGMGADGAEGLLDMKRAGAQTFVQDEESSVVFGMPKKAWEIGGADRMLPLDQIAHEMMRTVFGASRLRARS